MKINNPYDLYKLDGTFIRKSSSIPWNFSGKVVDIRYNNITWFRNGYYHSYNAPAISSVGRKYWYQQHGETTMIHRLGGAAVEFNIDNVKFEEYWVYDKKITKEQHDLLYSIMKLKGLL